MRGLIIGILGVIAFVLFAQHSNAQTPFQPVAVVNDSAITGFDLEQRMRLLRFLGDKSTDMKALRSRALEALVNDRLRLQYGKRSGITINDAAMARGIEIFAKSTNTAPEKLFDELAKQGIAKSSLEDMLAAQIVWSEVVRSRFQQRVNPGEAEIDAEVALIEARQGKEYRLREIGLSAINSNRTEQETAQLAELLSRDLNEGASFSEAVAKYSASPSRSRGGDIGWLSSDKIPPELLVRLSQLQPGQVTAPIRIQNGFSILQLVDVRTSSKITSRLNDPKIREQIRQRLIDQRSARLAEGLLQELRRDAIIMVR